MNDDIRIIRTEVLSDNWYVLKKVTYEALQKDGTWQVQSREAYDRGNGAAILLYDRDRSTVILTRQFRMPTYINGNGSGMLIEACAGLLDNEQPQEAIIRETEEETGYRIGNARKIYEAYSSPGSVTELLHLFIAGYSTDMKVSAGGGIAGEQENIEVLEIPFTTALDMIETGGIRDMKTILLLQYLRLKNIL